MSILNVNQIQPVGGGNTITVSASDVSASGATITASSFVGNVTGNLTGNVTGNVTSSSTSTFSSGLNVTGGSVGIGTDNPGIKLDVNGDIRAVDGTAPEIIVSDNFVNKRFIFGYTQSPVGHNLGSKILADGLNIGYYTRLDQNGSHIFYTNNGGSDAERLRITSDGKVSIGGFNPAVAGLSISNSSTNRGLEFDTGSGFDSTSCIRAYDRPTTAYKSLGLTGSDIKFGINDVKKVSITSGGNVEISNGNLVFSTSGTGIDFSATADGSGTTTSELFDDYEEGLWTPQVTQGVSGTPTYEYQLGWYTKIGRIVTLYFYIKFASTGNTGSNTHIHVGNFPFPIVSTNNGTLQRGMGVSNYHSIPGFTSANVSFYGGGNSNTFASVYQGNQGVATSSAVNSQYIIGGIEYISE